MNGDEKIIVVGASAGGMEAFLHLVSGLDPGLPAAICFVLHISKEAPSVFARNVSRRGPFPAAFAGDGDQLKPGCIFLAPPDRHMVISEGRLRLVRSPRENWTRPAIDPLFRSAAAYGGNRTIGILLSGMLDDGTDGLGAIKRCGGTTVVQDPEEAAFPDMPRNAIKRGHVDHIAPLAGMPLLLKELASAPVAAAPAIPDDLLREVRFVEQGGVAFRYPEEQWAQVPLACPECGGPLWEKKDGSAGYGCTVGHRFGPLSLMAVQDDAIEQSLWAALRMFQEQSHVLRGMAASETARGNLQLAARYEQKSATARLHAERLQEFLQGVQPEDPDGQSEAKEDAGEGGA